MRTRILNIQTIIIVYYIVILPNIVKIQINPYVPNNYIRIRFILKFTPLLQISSQTCPLLQSSDVLQPLSTHCPLLHICPSSHSADD